MSGTEKPNPNCRYGRWDCMPCINCDAYIPTMTNAGHIRAMTDEELADFLWQFNDDSFENVMPFCKNTEECREKLDSADISTEMCKLCLLANLQQPYESPTGQKG